MVIHRPDSGCNPKSSDFADDFAVICDLSNNCPWLLLLRWWAISQSFRKIQKLVVWEQLCWCILIEITELQMRVWWENKPCMIFSLGKLYQEPETMDISGCWIFAMQPTSVMDGKTQHVDLFFRRTIGWNRIITIKNRGEAMESEVRMGFC